MAKLVNQLTHTAITKNTVPGSYPDGANLYFLIGPSGAKSWTLRYTLAGKKREMGLGSFQSVSLLEARGKAAKCRALLDQGIDPITERDAEKAVKIKILNSQKTFEECALFYIPTYVPSLRGF